MTEVKAMRVTIPAVRLTDKNFKYTPACATDLRETFRKAREQIKANRLLPVIVKEVGNE
jgi:hypothetical protein